MNIMNYLKIKKKYIKKIEKESHVKIKIYKNINLINVKNSEPRNTESELFLCLPLY